MARKKKRADGLMVRTFTYEKKRYYVYGKTNDELGRKEAKKRAELEAGTSERENPTLNKYYEYFTEVRRGSVRESTIGNQRHQFIGAARVVIDGNGKTLGELPIRDITSKDIQKVQLILARSDKTTSTVNNIMIHLKHVFSEAVRDKTIDENPCSGIKNLKRKEKPARETIHRALTQEETEKLFEAARELNSPYYNVLVVMIKTGMRVGEVGALTVFDVDEVAGVIHVRRTITKDELGTDMLGDAAKTKAGNRDIPVGGDVLEAIRNQRNINRLLFGSNLPETIFVNMSGSLLRDCMVNREIEYCCKAAGIDRITSHALRATFATRFIEQSPENYKSLSKILGHSNINMTLDLYTHAMEDRKRAAMDKVVIKLG